jgi:hypothetical protein
MIACPGYAIYTPPPLPLTPTHTIHVAFFIFVVQLNILALVHAKEFFHMIKIYIVGTRIVTSTTQHFCAFCL